MKVVLAAVNAKYIHTNLALRYLKRKVADRIEDIQLQEFTINHSPEYIISEIYKAQPDVLCFSCYIWNIGMILHMIKTLKKIMPHLFIVLGGPEVSFDTEELMKNHDDIDLVVLGEGEEAFSQLMDCLEQEEDYSQIEDIAFRARGEIIFTSKGCKALNMEDLPFPYEGEGLDKDKIVYYESSRGCPFNCQYCLSSVEMGVRFLPIERVKRELKFFIDQEVRQVKFVDRTFNAKKSYAMEIMQHILEHNKGITNFHFEVTADLLDEEMLSFLSTVPVGLFQFEIGVQSTNEETLAIIDRKMNFERLSQVVNRIAAGKNIHQHLDLIVGLPKENYFSFRQSFNDVFGLRPEKLQIGFLKLLKGSGLRQRAQEYGYIFSDAPPYEVLENESLSYGELIRLKGIEEMVETFWNTGMFSTAVEVMIHNHYHHAFQFFEDLYSYWEKEGYNHTSHGKNQLYAILLGLYEYRKFDNQEAFIEVLKFDFLKNTKTSSLPPFFNRNYPEDFKNQCHQFLQQPENVEAYLPMYKDVPAKQIIKKVHFEPFSYDVIALEENPDLFKTMEAEKMVVLFHYELENKAINQSVYYKVGI